MQWIQCILLVNSVTPRHLNSPLRFCSPSSFCKQRPTGITSLMLSFPHLSHPPFSSSRLISFSPLFIWSIICLEPIPASLSVFMAQSRKKKHSNFTGLSPVFYTVCLQYLCCSAEPCLTWRTHNHNSHLNMTAGRMRRTEQQETERLHPSSIVKVCAPMCDCQCVCVSHIFCFGFQTPPPICSQAVKNKER